MSADGASNRRQEEQGGRVAIGLSGAESVGDEADGDDGNGSQRSRRASLDRRALVRSAMDGLNRFKQSWISVMLLKAGIGLGQVSEREGRESSIQIDSHAGVLHDRDSLRCPGWRYLSSGGRGETTFETLWHALSASCVIVQAISISIVNIITTSH